MHRIPHNIKRPLHWNGCGLFLRRVCTWAANRNNCTKLNFSASFSRRAWDESVERRLRCLGSVPFSRRHESSDLSPNLLSTVYHNEQRQRDIMAATGERTLLMTELYPAQMHCSKWKWQEAYSHCLPPKQRQAQRIPGSPPSLAICYLSEMTPWSFTLIMIIS